MQQPHTQRRGISPPHTVRNTQKTQGVQPSDSDRHPLRGSTRRLVVSLCMCVCVCVKVRHTHTHTHTSIKLTPTISRTLPGLLASCWLPPGPRTHHSTLLAGTRSQVKISLAPERSRRPRKLRGVALPGLSDPLPQPCPFKHSLLLLDEHFSTLSQQMAKPVVGGQYPQAKIMPSAKYTLVCCFLPWPNTSLWLVSSKCPCWPQGSG